MSYTGGVKDVRDVGELRENWGGPGVKKEQRLVVASCHS